MMFLIVTKVLAILIALVCLGFLGYWFVAWRQGDCDFRLLRGKKSPFRVVFIDMKRVVLTCTVPVKNVGRQNGTIMDAFVRAYLPEEQYNKASVQAILYDTNRPREDNYWEALIVEPGKTVEFTLKLTLVSKSGNILRDLEEFPDMALDVIYQIVGRSDWIYEKGRIHLTAEELRDALYENRNGGNA